MSHKAHRLCLVASPRRTEVELPLKFPTGKTPQPPQPLHINDLMRWTVLAVCLRSFANKMTDREQNIAPRTNNLTSSARAGGRLIAVQWKSCRVCGGRWEVSDCRETPGTLSGRAGTEPLLLRSPVFIGLRQISKPA